MPYSLHTLNQLSQPEFVQALGEIFEQTPQIAQAAWRDRPFESVDDLHQKMSAIVNAFDADAQLALITAHPDLGSKAKMADASVKEQSGVGLDRLTPDEYERFQSLNQAYKTRFGFPFIVAVKNHTKASILAAFEERLQNSEDEERQRAIAEISQIAYFRLMSQVETMIASSTRVTINGDRLMQSVYDLAAIGKLHNGGVSRVAFTDADLAARNQVRTWMEDAGMTVRIDAAGNIIGRYAGRNDNAGALATGSHIDTVPVAGFYDGCLGVLAGIEVVRTLKDQSIRLNHPIEVIVFTDEERSVIGSKAISGQVVEEASYYVRLDGTPIQDCLAKVGGDWSKIQTAKRTGEIAAFVELHVEQGGVLEHENVSIGVVNGVVGQYRFALTVLGRPNHAGTTPMHLRKDALVAAAQIILAVNQIAIEIPGDQVATVGHLTVMPNATNTVPGQVDLRIDLRDLSQSHLEDLVARMKIEFDAIAAATGTEISMRQTLHISPTLATPEIMSTIEQVCQDLGLSHMTLPSRAGHDAQEIGRITDMGMIFVPSRSGISHSEEEYTSPEQCIQGTNVLLQTFMRLDAAYSDLAEISA